MNKKIVVITLPHLFEGEAVICNSLFDKGLRQLHLRKPNASKADYEDFILQIEPKYRGRIVAHSYFDLVSTYGLKGVHLSSTLYRSFDDYDSYRFVSVSCHSFADVEGLPAQVSECFLSPVFDSISKEGYAKAFDYEQLAKQLPLFATSVVALGGVDAENIYSTFAMGFSAAAILGGIWGKNNVPQYADVMRNWQNINTPKVLSVAGFDPSSGAGVTADIKTAEQVGAYCFGVNTGDTIQNQYEFTDVYWNNIERIKRQISAVMSSNTIFYIKIGIVESFGVLNELCGHILSLQPKARICWDPILKSTSGFVLHGDNNEAIRQNLLSPILDQIYLITPNYHEAKLLFGDDYTEKKLNDLVKKHNVNIIIKGGHHREDSDFSMDFLYGVNGFNGSTVYRSKHSKHGTGCRYSSALVSYLAKGFSLNSAMTMAQLQVAIDIDKSNGLLYLNPKSECKSLDMSDIRLMFITHPHPTIPILRQVELACQAGINLVQLRIKEIAHSTELLDYARAAVDICHRHNAKLIINDSVTICRQADADGVHLGKEDEDILMAREILGEDKIIGATCNTFDDVAEAYSKGADYVGIGPFRHTTTKKKLSPILGIEGLAAIIKDMKTNGIELPTYAIGGIEASDVAPIVTLGIHGVAMSGSILKNKEINHYIQTIYKNIEQCKN